MKIDQDKALHQKSLDTKGYAFYEEYAGFALSNDSKHDVEKKRTRCFDHATIEPCVVTTVTEFLDFFYKITDGLKNLYENPVFSHGHANANYLFMPTVLRKDPRREHRVFNDFCRRFPLETRQCANTIELLQLMQHYSLETRLIDLGENPLIALYFACEDNHKWGLSPGNKNKWGEVTFWRANQIYEKDYPLEPEDLKTFESPTVTILSNIARMEGEFTLKHLEMVYRKDSHQTDIENYIYLGDVVRRSVMVRTPHTNERVKNQKGAFIIVSANEICGVTENGKSLSVSTERITELLMLEKNREANLRDIKNGKYKDLEILKNCKPEDIRFRKVAPYNTAYKQGKLREMYYDTFDLYKLMFKLSNGCVPVAFIPPDAKQKIVSQLGKLGITEDFVYPEIDGTAHEINGYIG